MHGRKRPGTAGALHNQSDIIQ